MLILYILLLLAVLVPAAGFYFYRVAFFPKRYTYEEVTRFEIDLGKLTILDDYNAWEREEIAIPSPHGYNLHALYFPFLNSAKTVIFSHGITLNLCGSIKYMGLFRKRGYNLLIYDNRFHGKSGGANCTFGYFEKFDLQALVDWVIQKCGPGSIIGTHGESLGAGISLQHAAIDKRISFVIADCPFSDLHQLFCTRLQMDYHLPPFPLLNLTRWFAQGLIGFDLRKVSPIHNLNQVQTPIFWIHGDQDRFILPAMSKAMFQAKTNGPRRLYLPPGAKHAEAYLVDPLSYERQVEEFLIEIGLENSTPAAGSD